MGVDILSPFLVRCVCEFANVLVGPLMRLSADEWQANLVCYAITQ